MMLFAQLKYTETTGSQARALYRIRLAVNLNKLAPTLGDV